MRRVVESRNFVSFVLSAATGLYVCRQWPFPEENNVLQMVLLLKPYLFYAIKYGFTAMLFTTPYILLSVLLSLVYIFIVDQEERVGLKRTCSVSRSGTAIRTVRCDRRGSSS